MTEELEKREKIEGDRLGKRRNISNTEGPEIEMITKILLRMTSDQMSIMQDKARTITCENRPLISGMLSISSSVRFLTSVEFHKIMYF